MTHRDASRRFGACATRLAIFWTVFRGCSGLALLLFCACSHEAPPDAGGDASLDAGHDAGFDAGHDAGWDAGHDAAVRDAAVRDAGPEGGWSPIADLPDGCVVEYTRDPTMLEPFRREPCPGRPGCERLIPTGAALAVTDPGARRLIVELLDGLAAVDQVGRGEHEILTRLRDYWARPPSQGPMR